MAWTKVKTTVVAGAVMLFAAGTIEQIREHRMYSWQVRDYKFPEIVNKVSPQVRILPTKFKFPADFSAYSELGKDGRLIGIAAPLGTVIQNVFQVEYADRIILPTNSPQGQFDFISNLRSGSTAALQRELKRKLGLTGKFEEVETDVLLLKIKQPNSPGLKPSQTKATWSEFGIGEILDTNQPMTFFTKQLEEYVFRIPVLDQTGLTNRFNIHLVCNYNNQKELKMALLDQLGLELVPSREPVEMLVVERVK